MTTQPRPLRRENYPPTPPLDVGVANAASGADTDLEPELGAEIDDEAQALFAQW